MIRKWLEQHHNDAPVQVAEKLPEQQQNNQQAIVENAEAEGAGVQPKLMMSQSIYDERYEQWLSDMEQH